MKMTYVPDSDTLIVTYKPESEPTFEYEADGITVAVDEEDDLISVTIAQAQQFVAQALSAGVKLEELPPDKKKKRGMVWYDADSSMISSFGYDEDKQILDVAFHRTGVYRYFDVSKDVFEGLRDASSQGSYMRNVIIDMYPYEKKRGR